jgi:cell division protein FtsB
MRLLTEIQNRARFIIGPLFGMVAIGYFAYHAVQGERGLIAWWEIRAELAYAQSILEGYQADRRKIEHRARLLESNTLDGDMLEERARVVLGLGYAGEIIVLTPPIPTVFSAN